MKYSNRNRISNGDKAASASCITATCVACPMTQPLRDFGYQTLPAAMIYR